MEQGKVIVFYGEGRGKTAAAIGEAIHAAIQGKRAIVIQFLKGRRIEQNAFVHNLEPAVKWFSFEKEELYYDELSEEKKQEAASSIQNGMKFARKVLATGEADVLVLDEVLGLVDLGLVSSEEIIELVQSRQHSALVLTGRSVDERIVEIAQHVSKIDKIKDPAAH